MEAKFSRIRRDLDSLGYFQILSLDSVPLVDKLLNDLKITTVSLQKYIKISQTATKEKEDLGLSLGPRKFENEKLVREWNDLHLTYSNYRSQKERDIKELRNKVLLLNEENTKLILQNEKLRTSLRETELDLMKTGTVTRKSQQGNRGGIKSNSQSNFSSPDEDLLSENIQIRHELNALKKELKNLRCKCRQLESLGDESTPEEFGEEEIVKRSTIDYKYTDDKIQSLENEIHNLTREKNDLEKSYKDALSKQHEAMKRAIHLAERNKELEKELKDIDQMAIAVEEECNDAVKCKARKLTKVEMALKDALQEIQNLERTIAGMKKDKHQLELNNDILRTEKKRMQDTLEDAVKEKSDVLEKMDNMKLIEHDLNLEVDRLVQESSAQKRIIAELESKIVVVQAAFPSRGPGGDAIAIQAAPVTIKGAKKGKKTKAGKKKPRKGKKGKKGKKGAKKKKGKKGKKSRTTSTISQVPVNSPTEVEIDKALNELFPVDRSCPCAPIEDPLPSQRSGTCGHANKPILSCDCGVQSQNKCCMEKETLTDAFRSGCCENMCLKHFQDLMKKEIEQCQCEIKQTLMKVTQERNHYIEEYHKLVNQMCQLQSQNAKCIGSTSCPLCPKTQQVVEFLQHENKMLSQEKMTLAARLEQTRCDNEIIGKCNKSACKRVQRERDLFKADVSRLEEECDCLRDNMKVLCEAKAREHDTFTQQINCYERQMKKIETERGELMNAQGTRRAQLGSMEEKNEMLKNVLRTTQDDLQNQKILYIQLKNLHDQTDKALHDTQAQLVQIELQLAESYQTIEQLKRPSKDSKHQLSDTDLNTMKRQLNRIDQEKDELLNIVDSKTEEIANLRNDLICKCGIINELRGKNSQLKNRLGDVTDRATSSRAYLKDSEAEVARLQKQADVAAKTRDSALDVNRKLQDELATVSREANILKTQLATSQEQIENLKVQSQQYIGEVKRAEDLIEAKEKEREELLNQFKQLCLETNHLQSSNNALESEANQSKVQLSVAMDHVQDLEQRGETLETLINDYEKQIGLLTNQIAKFESERNQHIRYQDRTEAELKSVRELCMKLDRDKEQLRIQMLAKETNGDKLDDLRRDNENLTARLTDSQSKLADTERLLKEARHESVELQLKNEETLNEIKMLRGRIDDLEKRLYQCTCDVCTEKCRIGDVICEKKCINGAQGQNINTTRQLQDPTIRGPGIDPTSGQKAPDSSLLDSSTPAPFAPGSRTPGSAPQNNATAQVVIADEKETETIEVNISRSTSNRERSPVSISSVRVSLTDGVGELLVEKRSVKGVMAGRPDARALSLSHRSTRDAICDCRSSRSTSSSSNKSVNGRLEMDKLKASLTQALMGGRPGTYCKKGECFPTCKLFDPLNKVCGKYQTKNYTSRSDENGAQTVCCPSSCRCALSD